MMDSNWVFLKLYRRNKRLFLFIRQQTVARITQTGEIIYTWASSIKDVSKHTGTVNVKILVWERP